MKKIVSGLAAAAVIATSGVASDVEIGQPYAIVGAGLEMINNADMGIALIVGGGAPVMDLGEGKLVAEGELTYSLMAPTVESTDIDFNVLTMGAYVGYQLDLDDGLFVKPRLGLLYRSYEIG